MQTRTLSTALALIMAISILSSAVAMWYDTLKIHAEIETGEVDVEFDGISCSEGGTAGKPWVAACSAGLSNMEEEGPDDNDLDLHILIDNAYPGYTCTVEFNVSNVGTIPVKGPFTDKKFGTFPAKEEFDLDEDGEADIVIYYNLPVVQIDPDGYYEFSITIEILQASPENAELTLQLYLYFVQWNEAPILQSPPA